jgi:phosphonate degradation associated HDIG domain protein
LDVLDIITELFATHGHSEYHGETVSQLEHALQTAHLAEQQGADDALVAAALLHDIGHLLHGLGEDVAQRGLDTRHEEAGRAWLARRFGPAVAEPVRLHVAAKRFLCATDPAYAAKLSPASQLSLKLQGGPFIPAEAAAFAANPYHRAAVRLRHWDDAAKVPGLAVPPLAHYRERLRSLLAGRDGTEAEPSTRRSRTQSASRRRE